MSLEIKNINEENIPQLIEKIKEDPEHKETLESYLLEHQSEVSQIRALQLEKIDHDTLVRILVITKALLKAEETLVTDEQSPDSDNQNPLVDQSGQLTKGLLPLLSKFKTNTNSGNLYIRNSQGKVVSKLTSQDFIYIDFIGERVSRNQEFIDPKTKQRHSKKMIKIRTINSKGCQNKDYWTCFELLKPEIPASEFQTRIETQREDHISDPNLDTHEEKSRLNQEKQSDEFEKSTTKARIKLSQFNMRAHSMKLRSYNIEQTTGAIESVDLDLQWISEMITSLILSKSKSTSETKIKGINSKLKKLLTLQTRFQKFINRASKRLTSLRNKAFKLKERKRLKTAIEQLRSSFLMVKNIRKNLKKEIIPYLDNLETFEITHLKDLIYLLDSNIKYITQFKKSYRPVDIDKPRAISRYMRKFYEQSDSLIHEHEAYKDDINLAIKKKQTQTSPAETIEVANK